MTTRSTVPARLLPFLVAVLTASSGWAGTLSAQQRADDDVELRGIVVDAMTGTAVPGAVVRVGGGATLTNRDGRFAIDDVDPGSRSLVVTQLGYDSLTTFIEVDEAPEPLTLELTPNPVALERITAMVDRFESDRNRLATSVRHFNRERLLTSASYDALEFVQTRAGLFPTRCPNPLSMNDCAFVRGRAREVQVFVDGARVVGGLAMLASYRPDELFLLEVIGGGSAVRAYTTWYVETVAEGRRVPATFIW